MGLWLFISLVLAYVLILIPQAHITDAEPFGITISQGCRTMIQNNVSSDCPSFEEIITLFPDTSNKRILGDFGYTDGFFERQPSGYKNPTGFYRFISQSTDNIIFIDPPQPLYHKINMITIHSSLDDYRLRERGLDKSYNATEHSLTLGTGRSIDSCRLVSIDAASWYFLVGDSIQLLNNNCDDNYTNFNSTKTVRFEKVTHDITTTYKYKLDKWFKESIDRCGKKICFYGKNQTAPP